MLKLSLTNSHTTVDPHTTLKSKFDLILLSLVYLVRMRKKNVALTKIEMTR